MTTLVAARADLGRQLGGFGRFTPTGGTTTTVTCSAAFASSELPASALAYAWIYVPDSAAPRQRRVAKDGLNTASGTITVEAQFGTDIDQQVFEVHTKLPAIQDNSADNGQTTTMGLKEILNLSARQILVRQDDYELTLVNGQRDYDLPVWLDRDSRLLDVLQPNAFDNGWVRAADLGHDWELREGGTGNVLRFNAPYRFSTGTHVVHLVVDRPGDTLVKLSGSPDWTDSTVGLDDELDEVAIDKNALSTVGLALCYRTLRDARKGGSAQRWDDLYRLQLPFARRVKGYDHSNDIDPTVAAPQPAAPAPSPPATGAA